MLVVTVYIANKGTPLADGHQSKAGHMGVRDARIVQTSVVGWKGSTNMPLVHALAAVS